MSSLLKILRIIPQTEYISFGLLFASMIIGAVFETVGIGAIFPLISAMGNNNFLNDHEWLSSMLEWGGINSHNKFILVCAAGLILFYFVKNIFLGIAIRMQIRFVIRNQVFFSKQLLAEYLSKPYVFHMQHNTAKLLRNVNDGAVVVFDSLVLLSLKLLMECITSISIWIMLMMTDPFTAVVVACVLGGVVTFIIKFFRTRIGYQGKVQNDCRGQYLTWANQSLGAIKETKIMHTEDYFLTQFSNAYRQYGEASGNYYFLNEIPRMLIEVVVVSGLLLLIMLKVSMGSKPTDIVPLLGLLALAAFRLMPGANRIVAYYNAIKFNMPFINEIYPELRNIQQNFSTRNNDLSAKKLKRLNFSSEINIEQLAFSYNAGQEIWRDVTIRIMKGDFVGIIGMSGAGKTTFVDVLLGLLSPSRGRILIDGVDMLTNVRGWQENIAYVPQNIYLIDASIQENIAFGQEIEGIDENKMEKVLQMAELYDYIQSLPDGLGTVVGERGVRLSGGQRQRIGIARALYRNPCVLILDEATSALDNETENSITNTLFNLKGKMTIIAIAHRVSTLEQCDYKISFQDGCCSILQ